MSFGELCLLSELANIDFTQFNVILVGRVATEGPHLASGLQSSWISILYSYVKPTHHPPSTYHPYYYHAPVTHLKKLPKTGHILCVRNLYTHTTIASE